MSRRLNYGKRYRGPTYKASGGAVDATEGLKAILDHDKRALLEQFYCWLHRAEELADEGKSPMDEIMRAVEYLAEAKRLDDANRT